MGVAFITRRVCRRWGSSKSGQDLIHWVNRQGGKVAALEERQVSLEGGRGLAVTQDVKAGDTLVALPPHLPLPLKSSNLVLLALYDRIPGLSGALVSHRTQLHTSSCPNTFGWPMQC